MPLTVRLHMDDYLAAWFVHDCGGTVPVRLPRGSVESIYLQSLLTTRRGVTAPPVDNTPGTDVIIPENRHKPAAYYNHLPPASHDTLVKVIKGRFDVDMWQFIHTLEQAGGLVTLSDLVYSFMEARGIPDTEKNWQAIVKRYQRRRNAYRAARSRRNAKSS